MQAIKGEMKKRNIKAKFLGIHEYFKDYSTKEIDERRLVDDIKQTNPSMVVMVICYSQILCLRFLLEGAGIFSEVRMNRDLCLQSKGQILTMSETQKKFLQTMAQPENIEKRIVRIEGQVGSGKTLLGIEVLKMKIAHYMRSYGFSPKEGKEKLRAKIIFEGQGSAQMVKVQIEKELIEEIGKYSTIEIEILPYDITIGNFGKAIGYLSKRESMKTLYTYQKTILLMDECFADGKVIDYYTVGQPDVAIDYIQCFSYYSLGYANEPNYKEVDNYIKEDIKTDHEGYEGCELVWCRLLQCQRSSQQILDLANFIVRHTKLLFPPNIQSRKSFDGCVPTWIKASGIEFVQYAKLVLTSLKDVMLIYKNNPDRAPREIVELCSKMNWKYASTSDITGSESSVVILYIVGGWYSYEAYTRAKHRLIVVEKFSSVLSNIQRGIHDKEGCKLYAEQHLKRYKTMPVPCQYEDKPQLIPNLMEVVDAARYLKNLEVFNSLMRKPKKMMLPSWI